MQPDHLLQHDTMFLAVDCHIRFTAKLYSIAGADICFKYQLSGEDLNALISLTASAGPLDV